MLVWPLYIIYPTCKVCHTPFTIINSTKFTLIRSVGQTLLPSHWYLISSDWKRPTLTVIRIQGLMFKVGIFMGWCDLTLEGSVPWATLIPMYIGACLWTITYETVYQHQVLSHILRPSPPLIAFTNRTRSTISRSACTPPHFCAGNTLFQFAHSQRAHSSV
jgi:hypothetical protein